MLHIIHDKNIEANKHGQFVSRQQVLTREQQGCTWHLRGQARPWGTCSGSAGAHARPVITEDVQRYTPTIRGHQKSSLQLQQGKSSPRSTKAPAKATNSQFNTSTAGGWLIPVWAGKRLPSKQAL